MGTSEKVNKESCWVSVICAKIVSLDADLKDCYKKKRGSCNEEEVKEHIKYFQNEKRYWLSELKKALGKLDY